MTKDYRSNSIASRPVYTTPQPAKQPEKPSGQTRPTGITIVCIVLALIVAFYLFTIIRDASHLTGLSWMLDTAILVLGIYSLVSLWQMKKWGAYAYGITLVLNLGLYLRGIYNAGPATFTIGLVLLVVFIPLIVMGIVILRNLKYMG